MAWPLIRAIDLGGYRQKNSHAAWQHYSAAPEQESAGTVSCPRAPLQKRSKSSVQAHSETGTQTYSLLLKIQQRWAEEMCPLQGRIFINLTDGCLIPPPSRHPWLRHPRTSLPRNRRQSRPRWVACPPSMGP